LYIGVSSPLSATYNSARIAAEELMEKYPDRKIITVDSLGASAGMGMLVYLTVQQKKAGASLKEAAAFAEANKSRICHWFTTDTLTYLHRGGRLSAAAALFGNALNLRPVTLGSSAQTIVGDHVAAIGNPLGELTSTLTVGYISAKERDITTEGVVINMLQTDAAINSGNSGGPLFNMRGEVIGITTAKYSGNSSSGASIEGVGFAIPIDDVIGILSDLADYGYVTSGYLGVEVADMNAEVANYYGMPVGAYIQKIIPGYAAEKAGLRAKDIIVELGGYDVNNVSGLTRALRHYKPGEETIIMVYRGGQKLTLNIVLDAKPVEEPEETTPETVPGGTSGGNGFSDWWSGFLPPFFGNNG
jgi:serine protease Do